jgi:hypothetical protein
VNVVRFREILKHLADGWEVEIDDLQNGSWIRVRVNPCLGFIERQDSLGRWVSCPIGAAGHKDWRLPDQGQEPQPRRHA